MKHHAGAVFKLNIKSSQHPGPTKCDPKAADPPHPAPVAAALNMPKQNRNLQSGIESKASHSTGITINTEGGACYFA
jgi:hypothetical protein